VPVKIPAFAEAVFLGRSTSAPVPLLKRLQLSRKAANLATFYLPRDMGRRMVISCVLPIGVAAMNFLSRLKVAATKSEMSNWRILGWAVVASGIVGVVFINVIPVLDLKALECGCAICRGVISRPHPSGPSRNRRK